MGGLSQRRIQDNKSRGPVTGISEDAVLMALRMEEGNTSSNWKRRGNGFSLRASEGMQS
jgi:hypothetical protein